MTNERADLEAAMDPSQAAQLNARQTKPKRFYKQASQGEVDGVPYLLLLDGRPARTPAKNRLALPNAAVAELLVAEWGAQEEFIDPATMPLTRIANTVIDSFEGNEGEVRAELVRYAGNDLICYRAGEPDGLVKAQMTAWDPLVAYAADKGLPFVLGEGVMHVAQPDAVERSAAQYMSAYTGMALAAFHVLVTISGSFTIAMSLADHHLNADDAWAAAHVDEDWQISLWGEDAEASARRAFRRKEFDAAFALLNAAVGDAG